MRNELLVELLIAIYNSFFTFSLFEKIKNKTASTYGIIGSNFLLMLVELYILIPNKYKSLHFYILTGQYCLMASF
jgi:hypothetical protein